LVDLYLAGWKVQAQEWAVRLPDSGLDLATAIFLLEGLFELSELAAHAREVAD
jgi:hypothetical protein